MSESITLLDAYGKALAPAAETRSNLSYPEAWLIDAMTGGQSSAGERVNWRTAITVMTFYACVRNISEDMASLPRWIMQNMGRDNKLVRKHPVSTLMHRPSTTMDRHEFWQTYFSHSLMHHGAYAYIVRDPAGVPIELLLLDPENVTVHSSEVTGERFYYAYGKPLFAYEVLHYHDLGHMGDDGFNLTCIAKQVIGAAIALQKMRGSFFGNGMVPSGILTHPSTLSKEAQARLREQFMKHYSGGDKAYQMLMLEDDMKYTQISANPKEAQMPELSTIGIEDMCRLFRMPPSKVQHNAGVTYSSAEHQAIDYRGDTIAPREDRFRAQVEFKLLRPQEVDAGLFLDTNLGALFRADNASRTAYYKEMYYLGAMSANEIRDLEHENSIDTGDTYFVQQNLIPADKVYDQLEKKSEPKAVPGAAGPANPPTQPSPSDSVEPMRKMLEAKISDLLRQELTLIKKVTNFDEFYQSREKYISDHMTPYIEPIAELMQCKSMATDIAILFSVRLCAESKVIIQDGIFDSWNQRAGVASAWLMELIK